MLRSSFSSFTTAQLAIRANQNSLAVVGQNMANVDTDGYTRQRLDRISLNSTGIVSSYPQVPDAYIGYGVEVVGLSQIRDPFLDVRYRTEMSNIGTEDKKHNILNKITVALDELQKDGALDDQFNDLFKQLTTMASNKDKDDSLVRSSAKTLTDMIRKYSSQLTDIKNDLVTTTEDDVTDINALLDNIQKLNVSIKSSQVHGNSALELQDQRNQLIDELATYVNIDVKHSTDITVTGAKVDILKIDMIGNNGERINLIQDQQKPGKFTFNKPLGSNVDGQYTLDITDSSGKEFPSTTSNKGVFKSAFEMLNGLGDYDKSGTAEGQSMGIGYYQKALDNLASKFAETFNNTNTVTKDEDGNPITPPLGGSLFGTNDGSTIITASNITISAGWQNSSVHLLPSRDPNAPSSDFSNIDNLKNSLTDWKLEYKTDGSSGNTIFTGTFQEFYLNISNTAATEYKSTDTALANYVTISNDIANSKDSVSGVNMDDEVMDMMKYNNSLAAASRLMTTLDEALSTIITSMGVVGR